MKLLYSENQRLKEALGTTQQLVEKHKETSKKLRQQLQEAQGEVKLYHSKLMQLKKRNEGLVGQVHAITLQVGLQGLMGLGGRGA